MDLLRVLLFPHPSRDVGREGGMQPGTGWASEHPTPTAAQPGPPFPWHREGGWSCGGQLSGSAVQISLQQLPGCASIARGKSSLSHIPVHRCPKGAKSPRDGAHPSVSSLSPCLPHASAAATHLHPWKTVCSGKCRV